MIVEKRRGPACAEDFAVGQEIRHRCGRTITTGLAAEFSHVFFTSNPVALNAEAARRSGFRDQLVPPTLLLNLALGQVSRDLELGARSLPGVRRIHFGVPVCVGDTLEFRSRVLGLHKDPEDHRSAFVSIYTLAQNQDGRNVLSLVRSVRLWKRRPEVEIEDQRAFLDLDEPTPQVPMYEEMDAETSSDSQTTGPYFEDFAAGDDVCHGEAVRVSTCHIRMADALDYAPNLYSCTAGVSTKAGRSGWPPIPPGLVTAFAVGIVGRMYDAQVIAEEGYRRLRFLNHAHVGDWLSCRSHIRGTEPYEGGQDLGVVEMGIEVYAASPASPGIRRRKIQTLVRRVIVRRSAFYRGISRKCP